MTLTRTDAQDKTPSSDGYVEKREKVPNQQTFTRPLNHLLPLEVTHDKERDSVLRR